MATPKDDASTQLDLRCGSPFLVWLHLENLPSPTSVGSGVVLLEKYDAIQHKAGADLAVTFIAVETAATEGIKNGALYQTR